MVTSSWQKRPTYLQELGHSDVLDQRTDTHPAWEKQTEWFVLLNSGWGGEGLAETLNSSVLSFIQ